MIGYVGGGLVEGVGDEKVDFLVEDIELVAGVDVEVVESVLGVLAGDSVVLFEEFDGPLVEGLFEFLEGEAFLREFLELSLFLGVLRVGLVENGLGEGGLLGGFGLYLPKFLQFQG